MKRLALVCGIVCCSLMASSIVVLGDGVRIQPKLKMEKAARITSAYPNPFHSHTTIFYSASHNEFVKIRLYNSQGTLLGELFDDVVEQGATYQFELDGSSLSPGVYYYTIESKNTVLHQRIELVR